MLEKEVTISNKLGLHARAAAKFVTMASSFECDVKLVRGSTEVNGKSIMGVMMLAASKGTVLKISVEGNGEAAALEKLVTLINDRFGELE